MHRLYWALLPNERVQTRERAQCRGNLSAYQGGQVLVGSRCGLRVVDWLAVVRGVERGFGFQYEVSGLEHGVRVERD